MPTSISSKAPDASQPEIPKLINLNEAIPPSVPAVLTKGLVKPVEQFLAINKINALHQSIKSDLTPKEFCRSCLAALNVRYSISEHELIRLPSSGPLVMTANHPFGGLEGIILAELLLQTRPDVRILANYLLTRIPALQPKIIAVDPINPRQSARANARALKEAMDWVADGGALLTFPAGEVSHWDPKTYRIVDPPWSPHIAKIAIQSKAKILPVYIHGRNSLLFNLMGIIHPRLRTLMLPREIVNKNAATIQLAMGKPIAWRKLRDFASIREAVDFLRFSTYLLQYRKENRRTWKKAPLAVKLNKKVQAPIIAPVAKTQLVHEINALAPENLLVTQKEFRVYLTTAERSPGIMCEIGRLRETSFRDVDEGTGKNVDIDRYDPHYLQLFLWNAHSQEIVGAYRLGRTDILLEKMGVKGLYSSTLFNYEKRFLAKMNDSLELGRSFIRTEYQKKFGCLSILWRGIGAYVASKPHYRYLFGPVSISRDYHAISKNLMVSFLKNNTLDPKLAPLVKPRRPVKIKKAINSKVPLSFIDGDAINGISMLISEIEKDRKGVPTLIKHYLKLNGRFLAFNLDREFSNVIDGLVVVDLLKTEFKLMQRFLGNTGIKAFYDHHRPEVPVIAA